MKKILILGATDMLGYGVVRAFLESDIENYDLSVVARPSTAAILQENLDIFGKVKYILHNPSNRDLRQYCGVDSKSNPDYIINCFDNKEVNKLHNSTFIDVNSAFPHFLADWSKLCGVRLIHYSTDHVFDGLGKGNYQEDDEHNAKEIYGKTKSLGEPDNCMTLRAGTIGPELLYKKNFLEWAISQKGYDVKAYTNHISNPITTKEYGRACKQIIDKDLYEHGKYHLFSPYKMPKIHMLKIISEKYNLDLKLRPLAQKTPNDRSLASNLDLCKSLEISSFDQQVSEL